MTDALTRLGEAWWGAMAPVGLELVALCILALALDALLWRRLRPGLRILVLGAVLARAALPIHVELRVETVVPATEISVGDVSSAAPVDTAPLAPGQVDPAAASRPFLAPARPALPVPHDPAAAPVSAAPLGWRAACGLLWILGAAAGLASLLFAEIRTRRIIRSLPPADERVQRALASLRDDSGRPALRALSAPGVPGAAVHGPLRPVLLVSPEAAALPEPSLRAILAHELGHVRGRDPLSLAFIALLQRIWWPHLLLHGVARRLRGAIEEARDAGAVARLSSAPGAPTGQEAKAYARLLLDLTAAARSEGRGHPTPLHGSLPFLRQDRRDLERRITMIMSQSPPRRTAALLATATMALGSAYAWTELDRQYVQEPSAAIAPEAPPQVDHAVHCEPSGPPPAWQVALRGKLGKRVARFQVDGQRPADALEQLAREHELPLRLFDGEPDFDPGLQSFALEDTTVEDVLSTLTRLQDQHWSVERGTIWVGPFYEIPRLIELRMYRLQPVMEGTEIDADSIVSLIQDSSQAGAPEWDVEGVGIEILGELLAVHATDRMHARVHRILDGLAEGETRITGPESPRTARLDALLDGPCPGAGKEFPTGQEALDFLRKETGVPILLDRPMYAAYLNLETPTTLQGPSLRSALAGLVKRGNFVRAVPASGVIWFAEDPGTELWIHRIPDAVFETENPEAIIGGLEGLIASSVDPGSWDACASTSIHLMESYVVCRQTRHNQRGVAAVLGQVERALTAAQSR